MTNSSPDLPPWSISASGGPLRPLAVLVGGLDPGGGSGVIRDFLTATTLGAVPRIVVTALTEQSSAGVSRVEARSPAAVEEALATAVRGAGHDAAVKIGMLPNREVAGAVHRALRAFGGPVVFDPVLAASSGGALYEGEAEALLGDLGPLIARATLVTPNAEEAARLLGGAERVASREAAARAGRELLRAGARAVLIKGGHVPSGDVVVDILVDANGTHALEGRRVQGPNVRGTGCALATAIAVALARGEPVAGAVTFGAAWLREQLPRAIAVGDEWHLPSHVPLT